MVQPDNPVRFDVVDAATFDVLDYLARFSPKLLQSPEGRRKLTEHNPLLFALLYFRHHLKDKNDPKTPITFSEIHFEWIEIALGWIGKPTKPQQNRHGIIAPRNAGKSTWWFTILPMWAGAHGHSTFTAAYAHSSTTVREHVSTFKHELATNSLLKTDFPKLCTPKRRPGGQKVADNTEMIQTESGFVFSGKTIGSGNLGIKAITDRPDLLILDDIEKGEEGYSEMQAESRLKTVRDDIFFQNIWAPVVIVGTVTMPGSIIHQLVKAYNGDPAQWILESKIIPHYYPPIRRDDLGTERSIWPQMWSMDYLNEIRHTRDYLKNLANDPAGYDGLYWSAEDIHISGEYSGATWYGLFIDPAVTDHDKSDYTGLAVIGYNPENKTCIVEYAAGVKLVGERLRLKVLEILSEFPQIKLIRVEANQGGQLWNETFHDMPVKVQLKNTTAAEGRKEVRFADALYFYQKRPPQVFHRKTFAMLEEQMLAFPNRRQKKDVVDAVCMGVLYFLNQKRTITVDPRLISSMR